MYILIYEYTSIRIYIYIYLCYFKGVDPLSMLTNDGNNAKLISEGLIIYMHIYIYMFIYCILYTHLFIYIYTYIHVSI
jgi:hypothetical protein